MTLYCPMVLLDAFSEYGEWYDLTDKAFWKYMDTYFDISEMKAARMNDHVTVINALINALIEAGQLPIPDVEEYKEDDTEPKADGTFLAGYEEFFYKPGQIMFDGDISDVPRGVSWERVKSQRENQDIQKYTWYDYCYFMLSEDGQTLYYPVDTIRNGDYSLGDIVGFISDSRPFPFAEDYRDFAR